MASLTAEKSEAARTVNIARIALEDAMGKANQAALALQASREATATIHGERKKAIGLRKEREDLMKRSQEIDDSVIKGDKGDDPSRCL
jgi:hypothetical protein